MLVVVIALVAAAPTNESRAWFEETRLVPATPSAADSVSVVITGSLGDLCWRVSGYECKETAAGQFAATVSAVDHWAPGILCALALLPYRARCDFGVLVPGHYVVTIAEDLQSLRHAQADSSVIEFDIPPVTAALHITWGKVRTLYR
jgi:hypothetical protein